MKKILTLFLVSLLLVSCGGSQDEETPTSPPAENTEATQDTSDADVETPKETPTPETDSDTPTPESTTPEPKASENGENTSSSEDNSPSAEVIVIESTESPEELVDDFGAELESLFDLIEDSE